MPSSADKVPLCSTGATSTPAGEERGRDVTEVSPALAGHFSNALPSKGAICKQKTKKLLQQMRNSSVFIQLCSQRNL